MEQHSRVIAHRPAVDRHVDTGSGDRDDRVADTADGKSTARCLEPGGIRVIADESVRGVVRRAVGSTGYGHAVGPVSDPSAVLHGREESTGDDLEPCHGSMVSHCGVGRENSSVGAPGAR